MKISQNYGHLSAVCFHCFTRFVKQLLAGFLLLFLRCRRTLHKKRVFRAICTYCKRLCNDLVLSRSRQRASRARILAHAAAHPPAPARSHLLCKNASNLSLSKAQKARSSIIFCQKRRSHVVFGGTEFCRYGVLSVRSFVGAGRQAPFFAYFIERSG